MQAMAGSQIKSWVMSLMRTKGRRLAVVAGARKLPVLLYPSSGILDIWRSDLGEGLSHLVGLAMRQMCGGANARFRVTFVW